MTKSNTKKITYAHTPETGPSESANSHSDAESIKTKGASNGASNGASKPKRRKNTRRKKSGRIKTPKESNEVCHRVGGVDGSREGETIAPLHQAAPRGDSKVGIAGKIVEIRTDFVDSDDNIPLPVEVPAFEGLEEAMLVRELRKDRLPGRIIGDNASCRDRDRYTNGDTVRAFVSIVCTTLCSIAPVFILYLLFRLCELSAPCCFPLCFLAYPYSGRSILERERERSSVGTPFINTPWSLYLCVYVCVCIY